MNRFSEKGNASDGFWTLEKRIREDKNDCGVQCEAGCYKKLLE